MDKEVSEWLRIIFPKTFEKRVVDMVRQGRKIWDDWWESWR